MNYSIGIDLGGSSIKAVTATPAGEALSRHNIDFDPEKNLEWAEKIRALVQQLQQELGVGSLEGHVELAGHVGAGWHQFPPFSPLFDAAPSTARIASSIYDRWAAGGAAPASR